MQLNGRILGTGLLITAIVISGILYGCGSNGEPTPTVTPTPTETVIPIVTPGTPTPTVIPTPIDTPTPIPTAPPSPTETPIPYDLQFIASMDEPTAKLVMSKSWYNDGKTDKEKRFVDCLGDVVNLTGSAPDVNEAKNYVRELVNNFPDSCVFEDIQMNNNSVSLFILSNNPEKLSKATDIIQTGLPIEEDFIGFDFPSNRLDIYLGPYGFAGAPIYGTWVTLTETENPGNFYNEISQRFNMSGPGWFNQGITRFLEGYVTEEVKDEPWFNDLKLRFSVRRAYENGENIFDVDYERAVSTSEKGGYLDVPLVDCNEKGEPYNQGHIFLYDLYQVLGQECISAMCKAAYEDTKIDEKGLELVIMDVAAKQGKTSVVQSMVSERFYGE